MKARENSAFSSSKLFVISLTLNYNENIFQITTKHEGKSQKSLNMYCEDFRTKNF